MRITVSTEARLQVEKVTTPSIAVFTSTYWPVVKEVIVPEVEAPREIEEKRDQVWSRGQRAGGQETPVVGTEIPVVLTCPVVTVPVVEGGPSIVQEMGEVSPSRAAQEN